MVCVLGRMCKEGRERGEKKGGPDDVFKKILFARHRRASAHINSQYAPDLLKLETKNFSKRG